ncbi:hypothetical protein CEXT_772511 [Caerostris extrusa]|uniref:Uncharacterized protein n=1 Tax=Caerostris extrusa TaxID=172846 RepID=A0AAV4SL24_CAEEX|nr:hypothetical protein CEXT_772511 [Caerostris extrusa]
MKIPIIQTTRKSSNAISPFCSLPKRLIQTQPQSCPPAGKKGDLHFCPKQWPNRSALPRTLHTTRREPICVLREKKKEKQNQRNPCRPDEEYEISQLSKRKKEPVRRPPTVIAYAKVHCTLTWMELHLEMQALNSQLG